LQLQQTDKQTVKWLKSASKSAIAFTTSAGKSDTWHICHMLTYRQFRHSGNQTYAQHAVSMAYQTTTSNAIQQSDKKNIKSILIS